jgi:hypothetical protein
MFFVNIQVWCFIIFSFLVFWRKASLLTHIAFIIDAFNSLPFKRTVFVL